MSGPLAFVTGAANGIGAATAALFAERGHRVVLTDIDADGGARHAAALRMRGLDAEFRALDVRDGAAVKRVIGSVEGEHGGAIDVLVNNAGYVKPLRLDALDDAAWDDVLDGNLTSMLRVVRAAAPRMRAAGRGSIICLSSIAGVAMGWAGRLAYSSAKAGITGFVRSLAMELAPSGIRVNGIAPAGLHTSADQMPLGRVGTPDDVARAIALLCSEDAAFVTGQTLIVDGGFTLTLGLPFK